MHRALKESTRLQKEALTKGTFFTLLRHCIEHRNSAALQMLFSLSANKRPANSNNKNAVEVDRARENVVL
jgi:hypothetical protein